jgi:hypothetical protein
MELLKMDDEMKLRLQFTVMILVIAIAYALASTLEKIWK